ncbi:MAG: hypothetical protein ACRD5M_10535 [Candidatus Acidiferrales bacterium]
MTREIIDFVLPKRKAAQVGFEPPGDLSLHMPQLRRRSESAPRWLALAALMGAVVALALVRLLVR